MTDTRPKILIVDDTPENIDVLREVLGQSYRCSVATSGEKAIKLVTFREPPDLILLDIMMPGIDGYEVCRRLKAKESTKDIPVIFVTAKSEVEDEFQGFEVGAVDYINKPISPSIVKARVATHLKLRQQQLDLQKQYSELCELQAMRDSLTHMIVHDLRSPLAGLYGFLELFQLESDQLSEDHKDYLSYCMENTKALLAMINDLLDVNRLESGKMPLERVPCRLRDIAHQAIDALGALTRDHTISITPGEEVTVDCDRSVITRVLTNLIGNALKFSPTSSDIIVDIASERDWLRLSVRDKGYGIPEQYREKIFEKFGQVEARGDNQKHSTGLGLTFCKLAVEAHGGAIGVNSTVGEGSSFWFTLPA